MRNEKWGGYVVVSAPNRLTSGRYHFHDLLRLYARELATANHATPERAEPTAA